VSSLKVTGLRSVIIYCDCGTEHKLTVDKNQEYNLASNPKNKSADGSRPASKSEPKPKRTIFDLGGIFEDDEPGDDKE
jgi:hypothetical protein